jgi:carboxyl-terminal processing protease
MPRRNSKSEFVSLLGFLLIAVLLLTNGFAARISAEEKSVDVYREIEPIGVVLDTILREYVREVDMPKVVQGALIGMMGSLDRNSSFITAEDLEAMREDTKGEFEGIGVSIQPDADGNIMVFHPLPGSPAAAAGIRPFDKIIAIDGKSTKGMTTADAANLIKGPRGTTVNLTIHRKERNAAPEVQPEVLNFTVNRAKVPLESIKEAALLKGGVGYVRLSDFKDNSGRDLAKKLQEFLDQGMKAFILDLRWNPGGLLTASKDACELFLPKGALVTYTKGRTAIEGGPNKDDLRLLTENGPVLPDGLPVIILVNRNTASSAEIVTGSLQFHERALVLGEKTFGKGSVQTIIPMKTPQNTALRLTTALYYTPADVTIDHQGILPDIELAMTQEQEESLAKQMFESFKENPENQYHQNHGSMTEYPATDKTVEDIQLKRAVEVLGEDAVWGNLIKKYHRDVHETQMTAEAAEAAKTKEQAAAEKSESAPEKTEPSLPVPETKANPDAAPVPENTPTDAPKDGGAENTDSDFKEPVW